MLKKYILTLCLVLGVSGCSMFSKTDKPSTEKPSLVKDYRSCEAAGYPILEIYPEQCRAPDGTIYSRDIGNEIEMSNLIIIKNPKPSTVINSPLELTGEARGPWYFEGSFSATLVDDNNITLGEVPVQAEGEWMTEEFVSFKATIEFNEPKTEKGYLLLKKANASGLPENDQTLKIPVYFRN